MGVFEPLKSAEVQTMESLNWPASERGSNEFGSMGCFFSFFWQGNDFLQDDLILERIVPFLGWRNVVKCKKACVKVYFLFTLSQPTLLSRATHSQYRDIPPRQVGWTSFARPGIEPATFWLIAWFPNRSQPPDSVFTLHRHLSRHVSLLINSSNPRCH